MNRTQMALGSILFVQVVLIVLLLLAGGGYVAYARGILPWFTPQQAAAARRRPR